MSSIRFDLPHQPQLRSVGHLAPRDPGSGPVDRADVLTPWVEADRASASSVPFLSIVIPARDEAASLPQLVEQITRALRPLCHQSHSTAPEQLAGFEIIVVDDGSTDETSLVLGDLADVYAELRPLRLKATVGQSGALTAGIRMAQGNWIATLDADLQNDPADLVKLWKALVGYDVALGWRVRRADSRLKRIISRLANNLRNAVLGQSIHDTGCSVRIFPRAVALQLPHFQGMHRFFGPLFLREGCRVIQVPVNHRPRIHGRSHYNLWNRSLRVLIDLAGVAWLMNRRVVYELQTKPSSMAFSSPHLPSESSRPTAGNARRSPGP
jgi:dolichol-phosphate mannosyltransferase